MKNVLLFLFLLSSTAYSVQAQRAIASDATQPIYYCGTGKLLLEAITPSELPNALGATTCHANFPTHHSAWLRWDIAQAGDLSFVLQPIDKAADLDFVLYRLRTDAQGNIEREAVRCMASGRALGAEATRSVPCLGATGLRSSATDQNEPSGCAATSDNFLAAVAAQAGEHYELIVNSFYNTEGFLLDYTGSATLRNDYGLTTAATETLQPIEGLYSVPKDYVLTETNRGAFRSETLPPSTQKALHRSSFPLEGLGTGERLHSKAVQTATTTLPSFGGVGGGFFLGCLAPSIAPTTTLELFPNPTRSDAQLRLTLGEASDIMLTVTDVFGKLLYTQQSTLSANTHLIQLPTINYPNGVYSITVWVGKEKMMRRLVVGG